MLAGRQQDRHRPKKSSNPAVHQPKTIKALGKFESFFTVFVFQTFNLFPSQSIHPLWVKGLIDIPFSAPQEAKLDVN